MTAPMDLTDDERAWWLECADETRVILQRLSDARAALRAIAEYVEDHRRDEIVDWKAECYLISDMCALATPAPVAVPAAYCGGCAKVARHPGEGYECMAHPSDRLLAVIAPDPVQAAYAECIAIVEKWRDNNRGTWTSAAIVSLIEAAALRAGVK